MIKANEAVVGRVFTRELNTERGIEYDHEFVLTEEWIGKIFGDNLSIALNDLYPIPLTPEWLERFGFVWNDNLSGWEARVPYHIEKRTTTYEWYFITTFKKDWQIGGKLQYVHQLQNIYHALTGEELNP